MAKVFTISEGLENLGAIRTGGQGSIYKAKRGDTISAVKILPTPIHTEDENDKNYRDFQNEVSKLKKVNEDPNPNVVKILSSGITESGSLPFIEMEFIEGPDLEDLIKAPHDPVFTISESIKVADQLSNALAHCHKVSVKHGDIKSNNVKLNNKSGNYMLLDFGLSIMSDEQRRTSLRHAGAIEFMAPEQNEGEMLLESDIYSFGIILFELVAGAVPFPLNNNGETSRNAVMISHMENPVPDILTLRQENMPPSWEEEKKAFEMLIPAWLTAIIAKCLEKRPENRFSNGMELHDAIVNSITAKDMFVYQPVAAPTSKAAIIPVVAGAVPLAAAVVPAMPINSPPPVTPPLVNQKKERTAGFFGTPFNDLKPVVIVLGILLAGLVLFAGYSSLNKPAAEVIDTAVVNAENERIADSIANDQRLNDKRIQDSLDNIPRYVPRQSTRSSGNSPGRGQGKGKGKGKKNK
ncbi:MAG TPA: serine/threonine-protein kinase [Sphingobacteriaceae bacterium]|nr:serine/threonine-protein kinase [Sphingobacteriaceae bacterium]